MTRRYREVLEAVDTGDGDGGASGDPRTFRWRGRRYRVVRILGHWREEGGWWRRPGGRDVRVEQADRWRVEARNGSRSPEGVYELVRRGGRWRLDRVWD